MRIAALDLGSNSFHMLVAEATEKGKLEVLAREKDMLRLGDDVGRSGRIGKAKADAAVESVRRLVAIARSLGADEVVAKATAALREAENGPEIVDRLEQEGGVGVQVISGHEEARLVFAAVRAAVALEPAPALCLDLGGGSLELMVGDQAGLQWSVSLRLGVGRLSAELVSHDPPSERDCQRLRERIDECLAPHMGRLSDLRPKKLVGSSGTLLALARMAALERPGFVAPPSWNQLCVSRDELEVVHRSLLASSSSERAKMTGLDPRRADIIPAGSVLLLHLMDRLGMVEITMSEWALREGIVLDAIRAHESSEWATDPAALRRSSVVALAERCSYQADHAERVRRFALDLFDGLLAVHGLGTRDRELLSHAATLHDIGEHVSIDGHERHGAYLIMNGGLRGFSPQEIVAMAALVRWHRRGSPEKASFAPADSLDERARDRIRRLVAILRVADALDRAHEGAVEGLDVHVRKGAVELVLSTSGGAELETWALRRKKGLFEEVFGVSLTSREAS